MELREFIKTIVNDSIAQADMIKRVKGKVLGVDDDNNVSILLNTMKDAANKIVKIKNKTGMTVALGSIVWVYYWTNVNDGWILPANMKAGGIGEYIGSASSGAVKVNTPNALSTLDYMSNPTYTVVWGLYNQITGVDGVDNYCDNNTIGGTSNELQLYMSGSSAQYRINNNIIIGDSNKVKGRKISENVIIGDSNTIAGYDHLSGLPGYIPLDYVYVYGRENTLSLGGNHTSPPRNTRAVCIGQNNHCSVQQYADEVTNRINIFGSNCELIASDEWLPITKSKTLIGDHAKINSLSNPSYYDDIIMAFGGVKSNNTYVNAMEVDYLGNLTVTGTINSNGADFAEFEEWQDGNEENADRRGLFVVEDGNYIRLANSSDSPDDILGAVSANPTIVGGSNGVCWKGIFERDVFGNLVKQDNELIVSDEYDEELTYTNREHRQEFSAIAYVGKVVMVDDGTCEVNGYCTSADNGIATKTNQRTRFKVRERIDETHILVRIL